MSVVSPLIQDRAFLDMDAATEDLLDRGVSEIWTALTSAVQACVSSLRKRRGCENLVMRIAVETGHRFHVYSYPGNLPQKNKCIPVERPLKRKKFGESGDEPEDRRPEHGSSGISRLRNITYSLNLMSMSQLRHLCSDIRSFAGLKRFSWPAIAKKIYSQQRNENPPSAPGRSGCTKERLSSMLSLCAKYDSEWEKYIVYALQNVENGLTPGYRSEESGKTSCAQENISSEARLVDSQDWKRNRSADNALHDLLHVDMLKQRFSETGRVIQPNVAFPRNPVSDIVENDVRASGSDIVEVSEKVLQFTIPVKEKLHVFEKETARNDRVPEWSAEGTDRAVSRIVRYVRDLPIDMLRATERRNWISASGLRKNMIYMEVPSYVQWYVQKIPGDGNCMFYAIMVAASSQNLQNSRLNSIFGLRTALKREMLQIADAGKKTSNVRREWLAFCYHELDDDYLQNFFSTQMEVAKEAYTSKEFEIFLLPIREYVRKWAAMLGNDHWGGKLSIEMRALASITKSAIEVLMPTSASSDEPSDGEVMCDMRHGGTLTRFCRVGTYFPLNVCLPSGVHNLISAEASMRSEEQRVSQFPLIRIVLENRHYSVCTPTVYNCVRTDVDHHSRDWNGFDSISGIPEPYADLDRTELETYGKGCDLIDSWYNATEISQVPSRHADHIIFAYKDQQIGVAKLSHLLHRNHIDQRPSDRFMLSDDLLSCYMHLLQIRHNEISRRATNERMKKPPRTYYMNGWFYRSIARGGEGPSSRKERHDLRGFSQIVIPALVNGHWVLAICYLDRLIIGVYDPYGNRREDIFKVVLEWANIKLAPAISGKWSFLHVRECRGNIQQGIVDCGIYVCKAAESIGLGLSFRMSQWDVGFVRRRMLVEILHGEATTISWPPNTFN